MIMRHLAVIIGFVIGGLLIGLITQSWRSIIMSVIGLSMGFALGVWSERRVRRESLRKGLHHFLNAENIDYVEKHE